MKDNKLISMVEYVKLQDSRIELHEGTLFQNCRIYAHFLSQPLTLGMFVPCVDGEPITGEEYSPNGEITIMFQQAQSRVLFEGFEIEWCTSELSGESFYGVTLNKQWCGSYGNFIDTYLKGNETIEGLNTLIAKLKPTLTETALKQINL
tara:strand:+ start:109 stop:555 length:447 start_codon:yes stop_codon:yes gene_type:complete